MSTAVSKLEAKVEELRRLFDESFASVPVGQAAKPEPMLAITVEEERFAIRVREISGLAKSKAKIVSVPSRVPELLGLTGVRGIVVPVFNLAMLLGFDSTQSGAHWLVFCGERQTPIALAFDAMESLFEVPATEIYLREGAVSHRHVNATVSDGANLRGVINISALVDYIKARGRK